MTKLLAPSQDLLLYFNAGSEKIWMYDKFDDRSIKHFTIKEAANALENFQQAEDIEHNIRQEIVSIIDQKIASVEVSVNNDRERMALLIPELLNLKLSALQTLLTRLQSPNFAPEASIQSELEYKIMRRSTPSLLPDSRFIQFPYVGKALLGQIILPLNSFETVVTRRIGSNIPNTDLFEFQVNVALLNEAERFVFCSDNDMLSKVVTVYSDLLDRNGRYFGSEFLANSL